MLPKTLSRSVILISVPLIRINKVSEARQELQNALFDPSVFLTLKTVVS